MKVPKLMIEGSSKQTSLLFHIITELISSFPGKNKEDRNKRYPILPPCLILKHISTRAGVFEDSNIIYLIQLLQFSNQIVFSSIAIDFFHLLNKWTLFYPKLMIEGSSIQTSLLVHTITEKFICFPLKLCNINCL